MLVIGMVCLAILTLLLSCQLFWAWRFIKQFPPQRSALVDNDELPRVVVVLAVRGADPSLTACLQGLLEQDYPHYQIRIIIDSAEDPAWTLVHQILGREGGPPVEIS